MNVLGEKIYRVSDRNLDCQITVVSKEVMDDGKKVEKGGFVGL